MDECVCEKTKLAEKIVRVEEILLREKDTLRDLQDKCENAPLRRHRNIEKLGTRCVSTSGQ